MVRKSAKGKVLGKEKKLAIVAEGRKTITQRRARDDKRWKRVLSKMAAPKKAQYAALAKVARKGVTRRFLRQKSERKPDTVAYECTVHLGKLLKGCTFNKRAPTAVKKIRAFAHNLMRTKDNRVDATLNNYLWSRGIKGVPTRVRVRIQRKVSEAAEGAGKRKNLYTVISHVPQASFKNLLTQPVKKC